MSHRKVSGENAFNANKGHFLGHASGGIIDINLFPQRQQLNCGWSPDGKRFRNMEHHITKIRHNYYNHATSDDMDTPLFGVRSFVGTPDSGWIRLRTSNGLIAS